MSTKSCHAQNDHDDEFCECENCFRANGGTFVYGADDGDLDALEHHHVGEMLENNKSHTQKEKWSEQDIREMISIWAAKDVLVNPKHASYYNTRERTKAVEEIRDELVDRGINFTTKQVNDKMVNLRTYYGSQRRQIEASKRNAASLEDIFVSRWKFFDSLKFISDTIISRSSIDLTRAESGSENGSTLSPTGAVLPPSNRPYKKRKYSTNSAIHYQEEENLFPNEDTPPPQQIIKLENGGNAPNNKTVSDTKRTTQDKIFGELITEMVSDIPEGHEKAMLKLEIQHKIISTQYKLAPTKKFLKS